ncbi:unnamed protein product [Didymodactylos carnosus]|uniref:Uncharacterized protein n=1 Tax=Didymodactylos carnosus TaxID=1234261 RepID=A0A815D990_9BILA|nr:unnamed protein product [Didymodactylos carnosus]CAF1294789.1 unnamed protein product [Didymodactylos carnosus]CAF3935644.1 unnamed protein product [Didymodactylos carnosus]CAF4107465.1 unnamed protein product [Didymodactylos carnosus]
MHILQLTELTDDIMNLCDDEFYRFLEKSLNTNLCQLFQVQSIRDMISLSSVTLDQLIEILTFDIVDLKDLKRTLGFVTSDRKFHLRLGHRHLLEHLLLYEFLRLNLPSALPHITNLETRDQEFKMIEGEFRFNLLKEYSRSTECNYIFVTEDAIRSISAIDYDAQNNHETYDYSVNNIKELNLTEYDIEKIIHRAFESAQKYVSMVNMTPVLKERNVYSLTELCQFIKTILSKSSLKLVDYTENNDSNRDSDEDDLEDNEDSLAEADVEDLTSYYTLDEYGEEESTILANNLSNATQQKLQGLSNL